MDSNHLSLCREPLISAIDGLDPSVGLFDAPLINPFHNWSTTTLKFDSWDDLDFDPSFWDDEYSSSHEDGRIYKMIKATEGSAKSDRDEGEDVLEGKCNEGSRLRSSSLEFDEISKHFYVPITQAAKNMKVGLTVLKKRCRELGISRWPHRKMKSLNSLIHNVQELEKSGGESGDMKLKGKIERLEEHKRLMEIMPEMQLTEETKKLRQACFKANYKKRRTMAVP